MAIQFSTKAGKAAGRAGIPVGTLHASRRGT
jgi:hypothetical protein